LRQILQTFSSSEGQSEGRGQSLFRPILPLERSCHDAGIPLNYCACSNPQKLSVDDPRLLEAAQGSLTSLNEMIPKNKVGFFAFLIFYEIIITLN
jgi:hypothetical protein